MNKVMNQLTGGRKALSLLLSLALILTLLFAMTAPALADPLEEDYARIILTAGDVWGDGTGYQMLLDSTATTYGTTIPATGPLSRNEDVSSAIYDQFDYKIPTTADGALATTNIVLNNSIAIDIPAGTYDYCITNPAPIEGIMWIAAGTLGRGDDYLFAAGNIYIFTITLDEISGNENDLVALHVISATAPDVPTAFTATPDADGTLSCDLSWTNPAVTAEGEALTELTSLVVLRNGEMVHTINMPVIGASEIWTDDTILAEGYYTYTVYGENSAGIGLYSESITVGIGDQSAISSFPWQEGFEENEIPWLWTQETVFGNASLKWITATGNGGSNPAAARSGSYNALLKNSTFIPDVVKLVTPRLDLSGLTNPVLKFWHTQEVWVYEQGADQDKLRVYYKTSAAGNWVLLATYTNSIAEWTEETISLPYASDDYYIAFEGTVQYGYGIALDDVSAQEGPSQGNNGGRGEPINMKDPQKDDPTPTEWSNPFNDVKSSDWFYSDVRYVHEKDLMSGTSATAFAPNIELSRAMLVTILWRMEGEPKATASNPFTDLTQDWYKEAVVWAAENSIVQGFGAGLFQPEQPVTREQLVTILYRYCQWKGIDVSVGENTNILSYSDALQISEYAVSAFQWACGADIVSGNTAGYLEPQGLATRAQAAAILHRFCENVQ